MDAQKKRQLVELIEKGDHYGLMLVAVGLWVEQYHPETIRAALYAVQNDDAEATRIRIPLSASGS